MGAGTLQHTKIYEQAEKYLKRYPNQMSDFMNHSVYSKVRSVNEHDIVALGRTLDQWKMVEKLYGISESDGSVGQLGKLQQVAIDVIAATFASSPINIFCGVQPMKARRGIIYFRDVASQTTRGNVTAGDVVLRADSAPAEFPNAYSTDTRTNVQIYTGSPGANHIDNIDMTGGQSLQTPIDKQRVFFSGSFVFSAGTLTVPEIQMNPATSTAYYSAIVGSTLTSVLFTVNLTNGTVTVNASAATTGAVTINSSFGMLHEADTDIPKNIVTIRDMDVRAQFWALKMTMGVFEKFVMMNELEMSPEADLAQDLVSLLNLEICTMALKLIVPSVPSGNKLTWKRQPQSGVGYPESKHTLPDAISDLRALIRTSAGRGGVNCFIAGLKVLAIMETLPGYTSLYNETQLGPTVVGTYKGAPVVGVQDNSVVDANKLYALYKGDDQLEAPAIWAPYMPLHLSDMLGTGTNPTLEQQYVCTAGAIAEVIPNFSAELTVDQTAFNYGAAS